MKPTPTYRDPLHRPTGDLLVCYNGTPKYLLNKTLLDRQDCWENLDAIREVHEFKLLIYDMINETEDLTTLRSLGKDLTEIEFELQRLWKFKEDINFHRFWEAPKCFCPTMDNEDGYPYLSYRNHICPLHGHK